MIVEIAHISFHVNGHALASRLLHANIMIVVILIRQQHNTENVGGKFLAFGGYMQIVKKDSFRSQGSMVNKTDDMYRIVVDMKRTEYPQFEKLVEGQKPTTNSAMDEIFSSIACDYCVHDCKDIINYCARFSGKKLSPVA